MSIIKFAVFFATGLLLTPCFFSSAEKSDESYIKIVHENRPLVNIVAAQGHEKHAEILASYIELSTGAVLPVTADNGDSKNSSIHLGPTTFVRSLGIDEGGLGPEGFDILFPGNSCVVIIGPSSAGTEFGVYEFLERYVGVRWLMPGPDGTHIPLNDHLEILVRPVRDEPVFADRWLSGFTHMEDARIWALRNRMPWWPGYNFHHNLITLFPVNRYATSHPEFYPVIDGDRIDPREESAWQPCFTAAGIVEEAVKNIVAYFDANPLATSFSLGINDNLNFCQCEECLSTVESANYMGLPDYSNLYYSWANKVVAGVLEHHPDKWFGCLAYFNVSTPPQGFKLHHRLVPYIVLDRHMWADREQMKSGHSRHFQWMNSAGIIGWYDYVYGARYQLPRIYMAHMADYLRFGASNGVKRYYAELYPYSEAYPGWREGPKNYVTLKLLWNPFQDVDELLADWYTSCVGSEAAPYLARYYDIWEHFWTYDMPSVPGWFGGSHYLPFSSLDYLSEAQTEYVLESRKLMEKVVELAVTEKQVARARQLMEEFLVYEAAFKEYHR